MWTYSYEEGAKFYIVPTPIGNIEDITIRAINVLKEVDVIYSEDTRVTRKLLNFYEIKTPLKSSHKHSEQLKKYEIEELLNQGKNVALVSDRGTPIISDPGYKIVEYLSQQNHKIISLPGATAFVPALTVSAIDSQNFLFYGFLNNKDQKRKKELEELSKLKYTIIFYEAPHRIEKTIENIKDIFGNRKISISREISKKFEEVYRGDVSDLLFDKVKGEYVIIVEGNKLNNYEHLTIIEHVNLYLKEGLTKKEAMKKVANDRKISKSEIYNIYNKK